MKPKSTLGWYNGWSPEERLATVPIQKAAIASGELARPTRCSICEVESKPNWRADDAVWLHDEDYSDPLAAYPVCRACHKLIHMRFWRRDEWAALIEGRAPDAWFQSLTLDPASRYRPFAETYPKGLSCWSADPGADR